MPEMAILARCDRHPRRPDRDCTRCRDAIGVNRMNRGWGEQAIKAADGSLVRWCRYDPAGTWFGPGAFWRVAFDPAGIPHLLPLAVPLEA